MELECLIDCAGTAAWRRMKARDYPEDGRNLKAAALLDELAKDITLLEGSDLHRELVEMLERRQEDAEGCSPDLFTEAVSEQLRWIGFSYSPVNGKVLVGDIMRRFS